MGVCLGVDYSKEISGADFSEFTDGKVLVHAMEVFDSITTEKDLTPFSQYVWDEDQALEEMEEGGTIEPTPNFDPDDGISTISAIIEALQNDKQWTKAIKDRGCGPKVVLECLEELRRCLTVAKKHKAGFCFSFY